MKILFMQQAGALGIGGLTRCLAVATEAVLNGHEVAFFCRKEVKEFITKNIATRIFDAPVPPQVLNIENKKIKNFTLADSIKIRNMDNLVYLDSTIRAEIKAIKTFKPNVVFTENQFSAAISSELTSVPLVTTAASVNHPKFSSPLYNSNQKTIGVERNYNKILRKYRLRPISDISELSNGRSALNISPTIPELEPLLASFPNNHYVGQLLFSKIEVGPVEEKYINTKQPLLFVYMSRGSITSIQVISALRSSFRNTHYVIVVVLREKKFYENKLPYNIEKNIRLYEELPGITIMKQSVAVITRGGQNTTMACMISGTPILGFPGDSAEADFNLRGISNKGAGINCKLEDLGNLPVLVKEITQRKYHDNTEILGEKIKALGGAQTTIRLIEKIL